jgi:hypothetical protein
VDRSLSRLGRRSDWPPLRYGDLFLLNGDGVLSQDEQGGCRSRRGAVGQRPGPGPRAGRSRGSVFLRQRGGLGQGSAASGRVTCGGLAFGLLVYGEPVWGGELGG